MLARLTQCKDVSVPLAVHVEVDKVHFGHRSLIM